MFKQKTSNEIRKHLKEKYYLKWRPKHDIYKIKEDQINDEFLINMYNEYIDKLKKFLKEINLLEKKITKVDFTPNFRQTGGYDRCVTNYPDKGWNEKYFQFTQAYKELMVDFIYYESLEYDDLSLKEIKIIKKMANFIIEQAELNIKELKHDSL